MQALVSTVLALAISNAARRDQERTPRPEPPLQDTWSLLETADQQRSDRGDEQIRMSIKGDEVVMTFGEVVTNRGTVVLGKDNDRKTIDFKLANGRTILGICEVERGVLVICADDAANGRPETFTPHGKQWVEKWKPSKR